jgi:hypothetical protein
VQCKPEYPYNEQGQAQLQRRFIEAPQKTGSDKEGSKTFDGLKMK